MRGAYVPPPGNRPPLPSGRSTGKTGSAAPGHIYGVCLLRALRQGEDMPSFSVFPTISIVRYPTMKETAINVNGTKIVSFHGGEGPELILLPSAGGRGKEFLPLFNLLSPRFTLFTLDYPGFGRSEESTGIDGVETLAEFIQSWIETLRLKSFFLAGFSMGGALALQLALNRPAQIRKLSLIATAAGKLAHVKMIKPAGLGMKEILNKFYFRPEIKERIQREKLTAEEKREIHRSSQAFAKMADHGKVFVDISSRLREIQIP